MQASNSTRDVAKDLQVNQTHVAWIRKKRLSDLQASSGGRPQVLTNAHERVCVKVATLRGIDVAS